MIRSKDFRDWKIKAKLNYKMKNWNFCYVKIISELIHDNKNYNGNMILDW